MGDLSGFEREQIVVAHLAEASVIRTVPLLDVSRATISKVMSTYTNHGKTTSGKRNSERKSALTERDHHVLRWIISKNQRTSAAQVTAELNIHLGDPVSTEMSDVSFTDQTSTAGLQMLNL
jgi:transposase